MRLIILGAGGYGRTVRDLALQSRRYTEVCFLDDQKQGPEILGGCSEFARFIDGQTQLYPAFGNNTGRLEWLDRLEAAGAGIPTLVHDTAYVSPTAVLEAGTVVLPKAVVNTDCVIGRGCIINCTAVVDHGCVLEPGIHICPGAVVKAENHLPGALKVESGEVIQNRTYPL